MSALRDEQLELLGVSPELRDEMLATIARTELSPARKGQAGAFTLSWQGRSLHSRHDPQKEAERQLVEFESEDDAQLVLFFGAGLGYSIQRFVSEHANPIVWLEPHGEILARALEVQDLREAIRAGRLTVLTGMPTDDHFQEIFRGRGNSEILFVSHRASYQADGIYAQLQQSVENFLNKKDVNLATLSRFDRSWARNLSENFAPLTKARPVARLFNTTPGATALVCGAGPSLTRDLPELLKIRDRCVVIAVDTALQILLKHGLDPDIVVSVDPQPVNRYYLEGCEDSRALFVVDPTTCYASLRLLPPERLYYLWSPFPLAKLFFDALDEAPGEVAFGGSVSTNAYDLALKMGWRRVLLAGQDLSFTGGLAHAKGAVLEERLNYKETRYFRREMHNYRQLSALPVRYLAGSDVPDMIDARAGRAPEAGAGGNVTHAAGQVRANDKLVIFHRWFSQRFAADLRDRPELELLNLASSGAEFPGVARVRPQNVEFRAEDRAPDAAGWQSARANAAHTRFDAAGFQERLAALAEECAGFAELLEPGVRDSAALYERASKGRRDAKYDALLEQMQRLDERVRQRSELMELAGSAMQKQIFQITENYRKELSQEEAADPHLASAKQSQLLYSGLLSAARDYERWFGRAARLCARH